MAKKTLKLRPWTKEDVRTLKALAREKTKTTEHRSNVSKGTRAGRDVGRRSREERGVKGAGDGERSGVRCRQRLHRTVVVVRSEWYLESYSMPYRVLS